jgi:NADH-quinone oxidoreductase subunit C
MKLEPNQIFDQLKSEFGESIIEFKTNSTSDPFITVKAEKLVDICLSLRDNENYLFDYLSCLSGVDYKTNLGVVYNLYSFTFGHKITLKTIVEKTNPVVPSIEKVWKSANWHEREAFDLLGVKFDGHPNLIRILCPYDWEGHPLQKDYKTPEVFHGMKIPY